MKKIYRVQAVNSKGIYYTHMVGAESANIAAFSVLNTDRRLLRVTSVRPCELD
jgi:hypothetical protein